MKPRIYVSGPITLGNRTENVENAIQVGRELVGMGFSPYIPHLFDFCQWDDIKHDEWMQLDLTWLFTSDAMYRIAGHSNGADQEEEFCQKYKIPIFHTIEDLKKYGFSQHPKTERFHELLKELGRLHDIKNRDYGLTQSPLANVEASEDFGVPPWVGALIRGNDKMRRLSKFARVGNLANESAFDSLKDLAVYSIIAHILLEEEENASKV